MWRKRGQEIERVIENTAGLYGDLQGMVGAGLPSIQALELPGEFAASSDHQLQDGIKEQQSLL
jgi:hypothetical protein